MPIRAFLRAVTFVVPDLRLTNDDLAKQFPEWPADRIEQKLGIVERRIASADETAADLAVRACEAIFMEAGCDRRKVEYLIFCTQSPDYLLPTTACILQDRLGLSNLIGAVDINLGCSGYVYGLSMAKGLVETEQVRNVLFVTGDTYSKYLSQGDKAVQTLFGDAAAATWIEGSPDSKEGIGPFVFGTDGAGAKNLIVKQGGLRNWRTPESLAGTGEATPIGKPVLFMNGGEIFNFAAAAVPEAINRTLEQSKLQRDDIDLFIFHQANSYMLTHLRKLCGIPESKFAVYVRDVGNTVSSSIPIALKLAVAEGRLQTGQLVMLVGFGVGYSWGACLVRWSPM